MAKVENDTNQNRYSALVERVFFNRYKEGMTTVPFEREDFPRAAEALKIALPKNLGDVIYSIRYRTPMPASIIATQPEGMEWIIEGAGKACYEFKLVRINRIMPNRELIAVKIPDATPEIISTYALSDEQALLAKIRYNRLIDIFLGIAAYSLQNHLRTTVRDIGQIEIDEVYVGVDRLGRQFVFPVQAKGGNDKLSVVQTKQDLACCAEKFPHLLCRAISTQFMPNDLIAMFELALQDGQVKIVDERHYRLVAASEIGPSDLAGYNVRG